MVGPVNIQQIQPIGREPVGRALHRQHRIFALPVRVPKEEGIIIETVLRRTPSRREGEGMMDREVVTRRLDYEKFKAMVANVCREVDEKATPMPESRYLSAIAEATGLDYLARIAIKWPNREGRMLAFTKISNAGQGRERMMALASVVEECKDQRVVKKAQKLLRTEWNTSHEVNFLEAMRQTLNVGFKLILGTALAAISVMAQGASRLF